MCKSWPRLDPSENPLAGGGPRFWNAAVAVAGAGGPQLARSRAVAAKNVQSRAMDHPWVIRPGFLAWLHAPSASGRELCRAQSAANADHGCGAGLLLLCILRAVAQKGILGGTDVRRVLPVLRGQPGFLYHRFCGHPPQVLRQWYGDHPKPDRLRGDSAGFASLLPGFGAHLRNLPVNNSASCGAIAFAEP